VGGQKEVAWREQLHRHLALPAPLGTDTLLAADLRFVIEPSRMRTSDLDNFVVPVAKALCYALFGTFRLPQRLIAVHATKEIATSPSDVGVQVTVWKSESDNAPGVMSEQV
jgi:hypothetical protein